MKVSSPERSCEDEKIRNPVLFATSTSKRNWFGGFQFCQPGSDAGSCLITLLQYNNTV